MGTIFRFILKNTIENKFRTFLIVFSIMIASALFFCSITISGTMVKMFGEQTKREYGASDIIITYGEKSPSPFFELNKLESHSSKIDYAIGATRGSGIYKHNVNEIIYITFLGININDLKTLNPISFEKEKSINDFSGPKAIISSETASRINVREGDSFSANINGTLQELTISAIANPGGPFLESGGSVFVIVPRETLSDFYGNKDKINIAYIKLKDPENKQQIIEDISKDYENYIVKEPITNENFRQQVGPMSVSFMLVSIIVLFISVFIIYSSFKVITRERMPVLGTFRSVGATRKQTNVLFLAEGTLYGLVGGALGTLLGVGLLYGMTFSLFPPGSGVNVSLEFSPVHLAASFVLALVTAFFGSLIPILKVSRASIRNILLNTIEQKNSNKMWKPLLGFIILALSIFIPYVIPKALALYINVLALVGALISIVMLIPLITSISVWILEKVCRLTLGNSGIIAAKNIRTNKVMLNNITLLVIGISCLLMINTVSFSVVSVLTGIFSKNVSFDMQIHSEKNNISLLNSIKAVNGVKSAYGDFQTLGMHVKGYREPITVLQGIDTKDYLDYWKMEIEGDKEKVLNELNEGRNILITNVLKEKYDLDRGSNITLEMPGGDKTYKVIGVFDTFMSLGNYALISNAYYREDMQTENFSAIMVKTSEESGKVAENIRETLDTIQVSTTLTKDIERAERISYGSIFSALNGFSVMTLVIGTLGVLNNLIISFIERKRSLAILRSVGMSRAVTSKVLTIEAVLSGLIGGAAGILAGILMIMNIQFVLKAINAPIKIYYSGWLLAASILAGIAVYLLASVSTIKKSAKLNIIETLKYE